MSSMAAAANNDLSLFGNDPWWLIVIKVVLAFVILLVMTLFIIWLERRVVARMQHRIGPNVHGPFGLLQSLADGVKLMLKEDIVPKAVDKVVFILAPLLSAIPAFLAVAVIPFGPVVTVPFTDIETPLQLERLKALGCELGQGFLFAKPMGVEDVEAMLRSGAPWGRAGRRVG